jgi:hypothetical protein
MLRKLKTKTLLIGAIAFAVVLIGCQDDRETSQVAPPGAVAMSQPAPAPKTADVPSNPAASPTPDEPAATAPGAAPAPAATPAPVTKPAAPPAAEPKKDKVVLLPSGNAQTFPADTRNIKNVIKQQEANVKREVPVDTSTDWIPSQMPAAELASKVASAVKGLHDTGAGISAFSETPQGQGTYDLQFRIKDQSEFKMDFLYSDNHPLPSVEIADGKSKMIRVGPKWHAAVPVSKPCPVPGGDKNLATDWTRTFTNTMFRGLTDGHDTWKPVVDAWSHGAGGYTLAVEQRTMLYKGHPVLDYRFRGERTAAAAKKLGTSKFEIVVDGYHFLPVTVRTNDLAPGKKRWNYTWECMYHFKTQFPQSDFQAPYATAKG